MMARLTPFQAILRECRFCSRTTPDKCSSKRCPLSRRSPSRKSPASRIRAYCRLVCPGFPCAGGDQLPIIGTRIPCWLYPFRSGRAPAWAKQRKTVREVSA